MLTLQSLGNALVFSSVHITIVCTYECKRARVHAHAHTHTHRPCTNMHAHTHAHTHTMHTMHTHTHTKQVRFRDRHSPSTSSQPHLWSLSTFSEVTRATDSNVEPTWHSCLLLDYSCCIFGWNPWLRTRTWALGLNDSLCSLNGCSNYVSAATEWFQPSILRMSLLLFSKHSILKGNKSACYEYQINDRTDSEWVTRPLRWLG